MISLYMFSKKVAAVGIVLLFTTTVSKSQIAVEWQKCLGSSQSEDITTMAETPDGGYILGGTISTGNINYLFIKTDSLGNQQWMQTYGGSANDILHSVVVSAEGGYLFLGYTLSNDGDVIGAHGDIDGWAVKTDDLGNIQWQRALGGTENDYFFSAIQLPNGRYLLGGNTQSGNGDLTGINPGSNSACWLVELDSSGAIVDNHIYQGNVLLGYGLIQTSDGGFAITGSAGNAGGIIQTNYGGSDLCVLKVDSVFNVQWCKVYGGSNGERGLSIIETTDGKFVIAGYTMSFDIYVSGNHGNVDFWAVKLDSLGSFIWQRCLGGTYYDYDLFSALETDEGDYLFAGASMGSVNGDISQPYDGSDLWLALLDTSGVLMWDKSLGGGSTEYAGAMIKSSDGAIMLAGSTRSYDFDVSGRIPPLNYTDGWLVKLNDQPNRITGKAFIDINLNSVQDIGEMPVPLRRVNESNTNRDAITNSSGNYTLNVIGPGTYDVAIDSLSYCVVNPLSHQVVFSGIDQVDSLNDFAFQPTLTLFDLAINITANGVIRPGFPVTFHIEYRNVGTQTMSGEVHLFKPSTMAFTSATTPPVTVTPDTITWNYLNLVPFETRTIDVVLTTNTNVPLGTWVTLIAEIQPVPGDVRPINNRDTIIDDVIGSMDPNDIAVDIDTILPSQTSNPPYLEYLIRFQNTGTYLATFIDIANPISSKLDMSTFELIATSHSAVINFLTHSRNLDIFFDNILLPDSTSDEPGSHGFVRYRIKPYPGMVLGDSIPNQAFIYFDYNAAVITNVATTVVEFPVGLAENTTQFKRLSLRPNPASSEVTLVLHDVVPSGIVIKLTNILGETILVFDDLIKSDHFKSTLNISHLKSGIYFIEAITDREHFAQKFVKK